jgi:hypothetical protein
MENLLKAVIAANITVITTRNGILAMSIGWLTYFYLSNRESKKDEKAI